MNKRQLPQSGLGNPSRRTPAALSLLLTSRMFRGKLRSIALTGIELWERISSRVGDSPCFALVICYGPQPSFTAGSF